MNTPIAWTLVLLLLAAATLHAQMPQLINYEGRVAVNGVNFDGAGQFKFALVDAGGTISYWSNDGTSTAGSEPGAAVILTVSAGQYSVLLGDMTLPNMAAIPAEVFNDFDLFVRVWFNDGSNGLQLLTPDQRIATPAPLNARGIRGGSPAAVLDCWQPRAGAPGARYGHTAVWTGSEMIVWGGWHGSFLNDGGRYDPAANSWTPLPTTGAPTRRTYHTAVWTGSEMIVWGGANDASGSQVTNNGGRYDPAANSWTAVSTAGAPTARYLHTAVWTGSEMIVWGGATGTNLAGANNNGGRYDPAANNWTAVSTVGAPTARYYHTAVWTGSEMIVWGGAYVVGNYFNDGGRYQPSANSWAAVSTNGAPTGRVNPTAVWTGTGMIVWGGTRDSLNGLNTGSCYHPAGDSWTAVTATGAPSARSGHKAVWTGSDMIVWGGIYWNTTNQSYYYLNDGGRYNPASNSWTVVSTSGAPSARNGHTAVWTGNEMIVWGGVISLDGLNDGARYYPAGDSWTAVNNDGPPAFTARSRHSARSRHTAMWTGSEMIVWGGEGDDHGYLDDGGHYDPTAHTWTAVSAIGAPPARYGHTAVWTGSEMIVWGGYNSGAGPFTLNDGGRYQPAANSWTPTSTTGAPGGRADHTAVWTGSEMIVWGGSNEDALNDGGRYNPAGDNWTAVSTTSAPTARWGHTAVWTGQEMIIWGGTPEFSGGLNTGGRYHPAGDSWRAVSTKSAPAARRSHTALWTGSEMIVWGGGFFPNASNDGGRYHPEENRWTPVTTAGAPDGRFDHTAAWTGSEMIVWGGTPDFVNGLNTGGRYHPAGNSWTAMTTTGAPALRRNHTAVWTGSEMIVWGGEGAGGSKFNDTFSYTPDCRDFDFTSVVLSNGNLTFSFPTATGRTYTLWRSGTLADGTWTNTGLTALAGTGATLSFTVPVTTPARRFFRVHAEP